ncbi:MAG: hypothetical protein GY869_20725 [Planctomycetes bacterium]|nr:hypothetical protein [Planctomycetota bacterium]
MRKFTLPDNLIMLFVLLVAALMTLAAQAADFTAEVATDKAGYRIGETVRWVIYARTSQGDNVGISMITLALNEDKAEPLNAASTVTSEFGPANNFFFFSPGMPHISDGISKLLDINTFQLFPTRKLNVGNDGSLHILAEGSYTVSVPGVHTLSVSKIAANYWPNTTANAVGFENKFAIPTTFAVYLPADIDMDGDVNFIDLQILARQWLLPGSFPADIAPEGGDGIVNFYDFSLLASQWLKSIY